jgi:CDGSH-type Zn-finger protein
MSGPDPVPDKEPVAGPPPACVVTIRCREHGPLVVELPPGAVGLRVTDHLGHGFPLPTGKRAVALCRCGHAKTRPFCDGSHRDCGFSAAEVAPPAG